METTLNLTPRQARLNLTLGSAIFLGAALAAQAFAARAEVDRATVYPQAEVAASIARQGNEAVRQIAGEAREDVKMDVPAPLPEQAAIATELAAR